MKAAHYDVSVWLFGLVVTVFVVAAVLIVREFRKDRRDDEDSKP